MTLIKKLESMLYLVRRHADPRILYLDKDHTQVLFDTDVDHPLLAGKLKGIRQKIKKHLVHHIHVKPYTEVPYLVDDIKSDRLFSGYLPEIFGDLRHKCRDHIF